MKKIHVIVLFCVLVLIVSAVIFIRYSKTDPCKQEDKMKQDECYYNLAIKEQKHQYCQSISKAELQGACIVIVAFLRSSGIHIASAELIPFFKEPYLTAIKEQNESPCYQLDENNKFGCFSTLAIIKNDVNLCELIPIDYIPLESYMPNGEELKIDCIVNSAATQKNISICELLPLYRTIPDPQNETNHIKVPSNIYKQRCIDEVNLEIALSKSDVSFCKTYPDHSACYYRFALSLKDPSLCNNQSTILFKLSCYQEVAVLLKDKSICKKLFDPSIFPMSSEEYEFYKEMYQNKEKLIQNCIEKVSKT